MRQLILLSLAALAHCSPTESSNLVKETNLNPNQVQDLSASNEIIPEEVTKTHPPAVITSSSSASSAADRSEVSQDKPVTEEPEEVTDTIASQPDGHQPTTTRTIPASTRSSSRDGISTSQNAAPRPVANTPFYYPDYQPQQSARFSSYPTYLPPEPRFLPPVDYDEISPLQREVAYFSPAVPYEFMDVQQFQANPETVGLLSGYNGWQSPFRQRLQ